MPSLIPSLLLDPVWRKTRLRAALTLYAVILLMGSVPGARAEIGNVASGLVLHSLAYGGLALLLFTGSVGSPRARAVKAVLCIMAMGAIDELIQSQLPYRHGAVSDWLVDVNAAVIMSGLLWAFLPAPLAPR